MTVVEAETVGVVEAETVGVVEEEGVASTVGTNCAANPRRSSSARSVERASVTVGRGERLSS